MNKSLVRRILATAVVLCLAGPAYRFSAVFQEGYVHFGYIGRFFWVYQF